MVEGEDLHYGMSSGTSGRDEGETDDKGIVPGHAYTLIAAREITNKDGDTERLVKLRNPWKKGEWNGKYSDADDAWTDELKEELEWSDENDGIFWMTYEDMCHNYDCIDICKIDDDNKFSFFTATEDSKKGFTVFKFEFPEDAEGHLTTFAVSQKDYRSERADGNAKFSLNDYSRKVDVKFVKLTDEDGDIFENFERV